MAVINKNSNKGFLSLIALLIVLAIILFLFFSRIDFSTNDSQNSGETSPVNIVNQETKINDTLNKIETQSNNYGQQQKDIFDKVSNLFPKK